MRTREKLSYGLGDMASAFTWASLALYLMYFYTDVFGISPAFVGVLFLVTRLWDAITDPIVGILADRTRSRFGRLRPYLLYFSLPLGMALAIAFTTPDLSDTGKVVYAFVTYMLLMLCYTLVNIPYSALPVAMTLDNDERRQLTNYRMLCSYLGFIFISYSTLPLVGVLGQGNEQLGFTLTYTLYGAIAMGLFLVTFRGVKERHTEGEEERNPLRSFKHVLNAKPFWFIFAVSILTFTLMLMPDATAIYFFKYYLEAEGQLPYFLVIGYSGVILGILLNQRFLRQFCKRRIMMYGNFGFALALASFFIAADLGAPAYFLSFFLIKLMTGITVPVMWAMVADVADYVEYRSGKKATGAATSTVTFSHKFGMSIGGLLTGLLFSYYGYEANTAQSAEVLTLLKTMMSLLPALGALGIGLLMIRYPLDDRTMARIRHEKPTTGNVPAQLEGEFI